MAKTQKYREAQFITPLGEDKLLLREMTFSEELGRSYQIDVELFHDMNPGKSTTRTEKPLEFDDILGTTAAVKLLMNDGKERFFNGYVTSFSQSESQGSFDVYHATLRPWIWFLTRSSKCRIFQEKTVPEIVKEVMKSDEYGFTDIEEKLSGKHRKWEFCVQYRETDFNFVNRLLEQEGIYYYFVHEKDSYVQKLVLIDSNDHHEPHPDYKTFPYFPDADVRDEENVYDWHVTRQIQPGVYEHNDYNYQKSTVKLKKSSKASPARKHKFGTLEIFDYPGEYAESKEGDNYSTIRIQEIQTQFESIQGQSDIRGVSAGFSFKLKEYPREDQNKEYLVVSASHSIQVDDYDQSGGGGGDIYSNSFTVIDKLQQFRPSRSTPKPIIQGPQTAVVVGPSGEEIYTDDQGRIKVRFHWDKREEADENSSCWIRVSQVHAGKGFGGIDIPRIGEEVIVEFIEGDPDRPIVTGRVYNDKNTASTDLPKKKMVSGLKSNSTPDGGGGYNEIMLDDTKEEELINVHAQYDMTTTVEHDQTDTIKNNRTTSVVVDDALNVDANRSVTIKKKETKTIDGGNETTITGGKKMTITDGFDQDITGDKNTNVSDAVTLDAGSTLDFTAGSDSKYTSNSSITLTVSGSTIEMKPDSITLTFGGSSIKLDAAGVAVMGAKISLNG